MINLIVAFLLLWFLLDKYGGKPRKKAEQKYEDLLKIHRRTNDRLQEICRLVNTNSYIEAEREVRRIKCDHCGVFTPDLRTLHLGGTDPDTVCQSCYDKAP